MAGSNFISFLLALLLISSSALHGVSSEEQGFVSVDISNKGLDFAKNLLIEIAESSLVPLELPDIKKSADIPVVGKVEMTLSSITINRIDVISSTVKSGDTGILIAVSGATANLTMKWKYSYKTWLLPVTISDEGEASVQVEGMDMGLTLSLQNQQGSLALSLLGCGCFVEDISITLDGGASWLYQGRSLAGFLQRFQATLMYSLLRAVVLPLVNLRLELGYHLPAVYGYELQNAEIFFTDSWITICSDVAPTKQLNLSYWPSLSSVASSGVYMV